MPRLNDVLRLSYLHAQVHGVPPGLPHGADDAEVPDEAHHHLRVEVRGVELDHVQQQLQEGREVRVLDRRVPLGGGLGLLGLLLHEGQDVREDVEEEGAHPLLEVEDVLALL